MLEKIHLDITRLTSNIDQSLDKLEQHETKDDDELFNAIAERIQEIDSILTIHIKDIPARTLNVMRTSLDLRRSRFNLLSDKATPFSFKSRRSKQAKTTEIAVGNEDASMEEMNAAIKKLGDVNDEYVVSDKEKQTVIITYDVTQGRGVILKNLESCKVFIRTWLPFLRIHNVSKSQVISGPVQSSTFVDGCSFTTLAVASQQLRIHNSTCSDFYCFVSSPSAIIEGCKDVRFGPYTLTSYPHMEADFQHARINVPQVSKQHQQKVEDFDQFVDGEHEKEGNWSIIGNDEWQHFRFSTAVCIA